MNSEYHSASVTIEKIFLDMFLDASEVSLRWLSSRAGMNFLSIHPGDHGWEKNLTSLPLSSASQNHLFLTAFRRVLPPLPLEGTL